MAAPVREGDGPGSGGGVEVAGNRLLPKSIPKLLAARWISVRMATSRLGVTRQPSAACKGLRQADGPWMCGQFAWRRNGQLAVDNDKTVTHRAAL